eukprot:3324209-Pyramimonas_sp.AAC.1
MQAPMPAHRTTPRRAAIRPDAIPAARLHGAFDTKRAQEQTSNAHGVASPSRARALRAGPRAARHTPSPPSRARALR